MLPALLPVVRLVAVAEAAEAAAVVVFLFGVHGVLAQGLPEFKLALIQLDVLLIKLDLVAMTILIALLQLQFAMLPLLPQVCVLNVWLILTVMLAKYVIIKFAFPVKEKVKKPRLLICVVMVWVGGIWMAME